jgi:cob(I)alamin adenosyltransferase
MMKTFNKRGDQGETSLLFGQRVSKSSPRCEFYGTIDEAVSTIGLARAITQKKNVQDILIDIQRELFIPASELAVPTEHYPQFCERSKVVTEEMAERFTRLIEEYEELIELPKEFVVPGGTMASAALDMARTIVRRAERVAVQLKCDGLLPNENILKYLNRLADLLFTLARYEEQN